MQKMKAVICTKYGPPEVLKIMEVPKPEPNDQQVLIRVLYTTVSVGDIRVRGFQVPPSYWLPAKLALGFTKPRRPILGTELSGVIAKVGKNVRKFKVGDPVFAYPGHFGGAYAEFICMEESACLALKPANISFKQAAALSFGGITAWYFLTKGQVSAGDKLLIYGASGSVGSAAVQIAKYLGAQVTGVCSTSNLDLVKNLGADRVIDYTTTDFTTLGEKFEVVFDTVGKANIPSSIQVIQKNGRYLHAVTTPGTELKIRWNLLGKPITLIGGTYTGTVDQIHAIKKIAEDGRFIPVIDRQYELSEIAAAHAYVDQGHKRGNVVIKVQD